MLRVVVGACQRFAPRAIQDHAFMITAVIRLINDSDQWLQRVVRLSVLLRVLRPLWGLLLYLRKTLRRTTLWYFFAITAEAKASHVMRPGLRPE